MTPNTIELFPDGRIGCWEMPAEHWSGSISKQVRREEIKAAKREVFYFKPEDYAHVIHQLFNDLIIDVSEGESFEQGKQYPIPDGYEVKIKDVGAIEAGKFKNWADAGSSHKVALLVPKEKETCCHIYSRGLFEPRPRKCRLCGEPEIDENIKQQSIEEAADAYFETWEFDKDWQKVNAKSNFIAGAKSQAAKNEELLNLVLTFIEKLESSNRDIKPNDIYGEWYQRFIKRFQQFKQEKP